MFCHLQSHDTVVLYQECHHNMVQYELPSQGLSLAYVFSCLEEAQSDLQVEDYSVYQNTLDNVSYQRSLRVSLVIMWSGRGLVVRVLDSGL